MGINYYFCILNKCIIGETDLEKYIVDPVLVRMKESARGSIYQSIVAMGYRSRIINDQIKQELQEKMADIPISNDESEGVNFDQLTISREFDKLPKPTFIAMKEISDEKLKFDLPPSTEEDE